MTLASSVLGIVPGLQATSLVAYNMPNFKMKPSRKMDLNKPVKKFVGTMVGISLIKPTASMINSL